MAKYRKKPIVVEAEQWVLGKEVAGVFWRLTCPDAWCGESNPHVHTLEGLRAVRPGDWIITGVNGEKYPCKPDIFEATYELVGR